MRLRCYTAIEKGAKNEGALASCCLVIHIILLYPSRFRTHEASCSDRSPSQFAYSYFEYYQTQRGSWRKRMERSSNLKLVFGLRDLCCASTDCVMKGCGWVLYNVVRNNNISIPREKTFKLHIFSMIFHCWPICKHSVPHNFRNTHAKVNIIEINLSP